MQTCQDNGDTEPETRESDDPEPSASRKREILCDWGKEAGKGNDDTADGAARSAGRPDIRHGGICKAVEAFLEHGTDPFLDVAKDGWIGVWRQCTARNGIIAIRGMIERDGGERRSVEGAKNVRR